MKEIPLIRSFRRVQSVAADELTRPEYALRYVYEVIRQGIRQLREDRAGQMAAALAFRTLFGLIPMLAIGLVLFQAFDTDGDITKGLVRDLATAANLDQIKMPAASEMETGIVEETDSQEVNPVTDETAPDTTGGAADTTQAIEQAGSASSQPQKKEETLVDFLVGIVHSIRTNVSFKSIGLVGILLLGWAAIGLLTTIERSFNTICRASQNRPFGRRVPLYWMVITFGPALVYLSFYLQSQFNAMVRAIEVGQFFVWTAGLLVSFGTTWLFLLFMYLFMPNTRIQKKAAAIGAFTAAILWTAGANLLTGYLVSAFGGSSANFSILYGTLGLIPIFMIWVYFMWVVVLFGLEVATTIQRVSWKFLDSSRSSERPNFPPMADPASILPVLSVISRRFAKGQKTRIDQVIDETHVNSRAVEVMLDALQDNGFIHAVAESDQSDVKAFTLARPPESICADEVLGVAYNLLAVGTADDSDADEPSLWSVVNTLREAQCQAAAGKTINQI